MFACEIGHLVPATVPFSISSSLSATLVVFPLLPPHPACFPYAGIPPEQGVCCCICRGVRERVSIQCEGGKALTSANCKRFSSKTRIPLLTWRAAKGFGQRLSVMHKANVLGGDLGVGRVRAKACLSFNY